MLVNGRRSLGKRFKNLAAWLKDPYQSFVRGAFVFREGTNDRVIFSEVLDQNEYRLPGKLRPDDIVIDIGAHICSFCLAAFLRGSRRIYGFEAEGGNYWCACRNLRRLGASVRLYQKAVWRSDRSGDVLYHTGYSDAGRNTGGGNVFCHATAATRIDSVSFDEVLRDVTRNGQDRVKLVKLDCEMAEFPILLTSQLLHLVDHIHGEFHERNDGVYDRDPIPEIARVPGVNHFSIHELTRTLQQAGFAVTSARHGATNCGLVFATRVW